MLSVFSEWQRESHDSHRWRGLLLFRSRQSGWWQTWEHKQREKERKKEGEKRGRRKSDQVTAKCIKVGEHF